MTTTTDLTICPFEVHVPEEDLADLRRRIEAWRPPELARRSAPCDEGNARNTIPQVRRAA